MFLTRSFMAGNWDPISDLQPGWSQKGQREYDEEWVAISHHTMGGREGGKGGGGGREVRKGDRNTMGTGQRKDNRTPNHDITTTNLTIIIHI